MRKLAKVVLRAIAGTALMALLAFAGSFETNGTVDTGENGVGDLQIVEAGFIPLPKFKSGHKVRDKDGNVIGCLVPGSECIISFLGSMQLIVSDEGIVLR